MLINDTLHTTSPLRQRIRDYYRISESVAVDQILPIAEVNPRARSRAWERARKMVLQIRREVNSLRKRGKHVQVGLLLAEQSTPPIPMDTVVAHELEVIGSHGMQAYRYEAMFGMIATKKLNPQALIGKIISLQEAPKALTEMDKYSQPGVTVISFDEK